MRVKKSTMNDKRIQVATTLVHMINWWSVAAQAIARWIRPDKKLALFLICLVLTSCFGDGPGTHNVITNSEITNQTAYLVTLRFFKGSAADDENVLVVPSHGRLRVLTDRHSGSEQGPTFVDTISTFEYDSLVMDFSSGKTITHYGELVHGNTVPACHFEDPANLFTINAWATTISSSTSGNHTETTFTSEYSITPGFYELFAR